MLIRQILPDFPDLLKEPAGSTSRGELSTGSMIKSDSSLDTANSTTPTDKGGKRTLRTYTAFTEPVLSLCISCTGTLSPSCISQVPQFNFTNYFCRMLKSIPRNISSCNEAIYKQCATISTSIPNCPGPMEQTDKVAEVKPNSHHLTITWVG